MQREILCRPGALSSDNYRDLYLVRQRGRARLSPPWYNNQIYVVNVSPGTFIERVRLVHPDATEFRVGICNSEPRYALKTSMTSVGREMSISDIVLNGNMHSTWFSDQMFAKMAYSATSQGLIDRGPNIMGMSRGMRDCVENAIVADGLLPPEKRALTYPNVASWDEFFVAPEVLTTPPPSTIEVELTIRWFAHSLDGSDDPDRLHPVFQ